MTRWCVSATLEKEKMTTAKKSYRYPKINVVMGFGLIPAAIIFIWLFSLLILHGKGAAESWLPYAISTIFAIPTIVSILLIVNLSKTSVTVDAEHLTYTTLFKNLKIRWEDVNSVKKEYVLAGRYGGPPRDLQIELQNNNKLNIFYFILNAENENWDEDGMAEFVNNLKAYVGERFIEEA